MFRNKLKTHFENIFGFKKTTYDTPSDQYEQDTIFINVDQCQSRITEGREIAKVNGTITIFSQHEKLPFGFLNKRIQNANFDDTRRLFFYDFEEDPANSPARILNLSERRAKFVFLYDAQYDPNQGELTSVEFGE